MSAGPEPESSKGDRSLPQKQLEQKQQGIPGRLNEAHEDSDIKTEPEPQSESTIVAVATLTEPTQEDLEAERQRDGEEMAKIALDDLRSFDVKGYSEKFCRYALMKIISKYWDYKRQEEDCQKRYYETDNQKRKLLRHFKLCSDCFHGTFHNGKRTKSKIVKGVHDQGGVLTKGNSSVNVYAYPYAYLTTIQPSNP